MCVARPPLKFLSRLPLSTQAGVAVRSGHHCTQPLHRHLGIPASARASLYLYNSPAEVEQFVRSLKETVAFFREVNGSA